MKKNSKRRTAEKRTIEGKIAERKTTKEEIKKIAAFKTILTGTLVLSGQFFSVLVYADAPQISAMRDVFVKDSNSKSKENADKTENLSKLDTDKITSIKSRMQSDENITDSSLFLLDIPKLDTAESPTEAITIGYKAGNAESISKSLPGISGQYIINTLDSNKSVISNSQNVYYHDGMVYDLDSNGKIVSKKSIADTIQKSENDTYIINTKRLIQNDPRWKNARIGHTTFWAAGCFPTGMTIILNHFLGKDWTPIVTAQDLYNQGFFNGYYRGKAVKGVYKIDQAEQYLSEEYGIPMKMTNSLEEVRQALKDGKMVGADIYENDPIEFHFCAFGGYTKDSDGTEYTYSYDSYFEGSSETPTKRTLNNVFSKHITSSMVNSITKPYNSACWYIWG